MLSLVNEKGPPEFLDAVSDAYSRAYTEAHPAKVDEAAAKLVRAAGWYKTKSDRGGEEWKQLTPDLRDKLNIRRAVKQPDGKNLVEDVDVFYPNSVKGDDAASQYTPERVKSFISTTNDMINSGGQPPGVVKEHPTQGRKDAGIATPVHGYGINFRESPRGNGWARCDLLVDDKTCDEWKQGKWIGLSSGFACDKNGTNMRFGHIALLGADMQALHKLPRVELFSSETNQLCFSTDAGVLGNSAPSYLSVSKETHMPLTEAQKTAMALMADAHTKMSMAFSASASGAADADAKDQEAASAFAAAETKMKECGLYASGDEGNPLYDENANTPVPSDEELDALLAMEPPATTDVGAPSGAAAGGGQYSVDPNANAQFAAQKVETESLRAELQVQRKVTQALLGKQMRDEFSAFMKDKQSAGHMFDAETNMKLFTAIAGNPDAVANLKRVIETSPKDPKLAGQTFAAGDAGKNIQREVNGSAGNLAPAAGEINEVLGLLRKHVPHLNFSADDVKLGMVAEAGK